MAQGEVASTPRLGPSFPCPAPRDPLGQLICSSQELSKDDLRLVQTYQALRYQLDPAGRDALTQESINFTARVHAQCGIPAIDSGLTADPTTIPCVESEYEKQRDLWASRLNGAAAEEAARDLRQHVGLQADLRTLGFLPSDSPIDGVYGPATRSAIVAWQQSQQRRPTGFLGDVDAAAIEQQVAQAGQGTTQTARQTAGPIDWASARERLLKEAKQGDAESQYLLCKVVVAGKGGPADYGEALKWCLKSAEQGYQKAPFEVGRFYALGLGVPRDPQEARKWFTMGAEAGDPNAEYVLGLFFLQGTAGPQSDSAARSWLEKAAEQGVPQAKQALRQLGSASGQNAPRPAQETNTNVVELRCIAPSGTFGFRFYLDMVHDRLIQFEDTSVDEPLTLTDSTISWNLSHDDLVRALGPGATLDNASMVLNRRDLTIRLNLTGSFIWQCQLFRNQL
jgi:TPR repeat protein/uncharacterized protein YecT (DUF1311 family)